MNAWRTLDDERSLAEAQHFLATEMIAQGDAGAAVTLATSSVRCFVEPPPISFGLATTLATLGIAEMTLNNYAAAPIALEESATIARAIGDKLGAGVAVEDLGIVAFRQGDYAEGAELVRETLRILRASRGSGSSRAATRRWPRSLPFSATMFERRGYSAPVKRSERPSAHLSSLFTGPTKTMPSRPSEWAWEMRRFGSTGHKAVR